MDEFNDSALSDIRNELDSARKLPNSCNKKDRLLSDI
jgi:hypothetical protein